MKNEENLNRETDYMTFVPTRDDAAGPAQKRIAAPRNFWGGLALMVLATLGLYLASDLGVMKSFMFGAGTVPRLICYLLAGLSVLLIIAGLTVPGPTLPGLAVRGPALLLCSIVFFALAVRPLGIVIATFVAFLLASAAGKDMRWREAVIAAFVVTTFCTGLFHFALGLPFALLPRL